MKTITITFYIDVIGALSSHSIQGCLYGLDNNRREGSRNQGTSSLKTKVSKGDRLIWNSSSIEPESFSEITKIEIDASFCEIEKHYYPGSDIVFWSGKVIKQFTRLNYNISVVMGHTRHEYQTEPGLELIS